MNQNLASQFEEELAHWSQANQMVKIWWRDDDAITYTSELEKLTAIAIRHEIPVLLAVIPAFADKALSKHVQNNLLLSAATHGYSHTVQSSNGQKKTELTENQEGRSVQQVLEELQASQKIIDELFGKPASQILVPPWNRIDNEIADKLPDIGFRLISGFTAKNSTDNLVNLNCHLDIMQWKPERRGKQAGAVFGELLICLRESRNLGFSPIGILSHHLVHDDVAWQVSAELMAYFNDNDCYEAISVTDFVS